MKLEKILPRPLGDSGSDCASIFGSLIMAAHFERTRARALGWRGVRPSASEHPAWTCRVAGCEPVFGIRFDGEEHCPQPDCLRGWFGLYVFPETESPLLDTFPLDALRFALSPAYASAVREFSGAEAELQPFRLGSLRLDASFAGDALALTLEAPARHRVIAADGIPADDGWLVAPGAPECDVPAFSLFLRLFAVLTATAEEELGETAALARGMSVQPRLCFHRGGSLEAFGSEQQAVLSLTASFGPPLALEGEASHSLAALPARYRPDELERHSRPLLHVLTGFLGAGKTTFLRRWLDFLHGRERYTGVIQNEFGKVELDAALMKGDTIVEALDEGCVCCSLADSLRPGLERIIAAMPAEQFVLETTGLANPDNIMDALNGLRDLVTPGLVITVADALDLCTAEEAKHEQPEASGIRRAQLQKADVIILNKSDAVPAEALEALTARLRALNARALLLPARYGAVPFAELDAWMDAHEGKRLPSHLPTLMRLGERAVTHAEEGYEAKALTFEGPVSADGLKALLHDAGPGLCRAKGILDIENAGVCIVQYAAGRLELTPAPEETPLDLVLIGTGLKL
ncbi:CobW family GTP-binding protein [uncultured Mailhella sp.]|uniref:CobW family GTP-binding protein n=1 Tax=uncultured Mailhella sp. TaxID=1981031 RepID=UPI0026108F65|nr:CobW family GTP-binding protein [uncultured Mailhella sp.]